MVFFFVLFSFVFLSRGPFLNEDDEKVRLNEAYLRSGPIFQKAFEPEAGYELAYYRPVNNLILSSLARTFGVKSSTPFRMAGAVAFCAMIIVVYFIARRCGLGAELSLLPAAFFAFHPFNSWFYFQGAWTANSLAFCLMWAVWQIYEKSILRWKVTPKIFFYLLFLSYAACLCKDSAALIFPIILIHALTVKGGDKRQKRFAAAGVFLGVYLYVIQRQWLIHPDPHLFPSKPWFAISHAGWLWVEYVFHFLRGAHLNYGRAVWAAPGLPITVAVTGFFLFILWRSRHRREEAFLFACLGIFASESVLGSFRSFWIFPTRVQYAGSIFFLWFVVFLKNRWSFILKPFQKMIIVAVTLILAAYSVFSFEHIKAAQNKETFYADHNQTPYSAKLLYIEGRWRMEKEEWRKAEALFQQSLNLYKSTLAYKNLGITLNHEERYLEAINSFAEALKLNSKNLAVLENLAISLNKASWDNLDLAAKLDPLNDAHIVYNNLGVLLAEKGETQKAKTLFEYSLSISPDFIPARHNLELLG